MSRSPCIIPASPSGSRMDTVHPYVEICSPTPKYSSESINVGNLWQKLSSLCALIDKEFNIFTYESSIDILGGTYGKGFGDIVMTDDEEKSVKDLESLRIIYRKTKACIEKLSNHQYSHMAIDELITLLYTIRLRINTVTRFLRYKTEWCHKKDNAEGCPFQNNGLCRFAHTAEEKRILPPLLWPLNAKRSICQSWLSIGTCRYGSRCCFVHDESSEELDNIHAFIDCNNSSDIIENISEIIDSSQTNKNMIKNANFDELPLKPISFSEVWNGMISMSHVPRIKHAIESDEEYDQEIVMITSPPKKAKVCRLSSRQYIDINESPTIIHSTPQRHLAERDGTDNDDETACFMQRIMGSKDILSDDHYSDCESDDSVSCSSNRCNSNLFYNHKEIKNIYLPCRVEVYHGSGLLYDPSDISFDLSSLTLATNHSFSKVVGSYSRGFAPISVGIVY